MPTLTPGLGYGGVGPRVGAIVIAAGYSRRMDGHDKILLPLMGRPLIAHSMQVVNDCSQVETIVLVMSPPNIERGRRMVEENCWHKVKEVCAGGERRQESVRLGLDRMGDTDWTVVHDGARPCIEEDLIVKGLHEASYSGAAVAAVPVKDTIKATGPDLVVTQTLARDGLWAVQTPQVFKTEILSRAHATISRDATDDASMVEQMGATVRIFMGSYENIKVTTPEDIPIAEAILRARAGKGPGPNP